MIIPWQELPPETLESIIESFVLREGTDYGEQEKTLQQKVDDIKRQLKSGKLVLIWSELHETINIMLKDQFSDGAEEQPYPDFN
ncbi:YheU family protein [Pragia fontium]|uniref:UPF0270 protein SAMN02745723_11148 n=2 Tax=Pragia fontium TaxID=82985 RepID=A0AAJ4WCP4_9GAMM|nr:YheU family protein [Pragia fontium]AKJ40921.1 hypothetical protein QQ39_01515 [Pragia fontium]GKX64602.1 UPF0270 protein [Pragia fontium]SFD25494.1 hypothetical protein SAMN02745723_11148 [Pragia fontium DSM 5563 = ATCC 49100]VEJ53071.1 Uncharacterised protein family (UPF0270) [Pragia fontium]